MPDLRNRPHGRHAAFDHRRMLLALLGLSGFAGVALAGYYLTGDAHPVDPIPGIDVAVELSGPEAVRMTPSPGSRTGGGRHGVEDASGWRSEGAAPMASQVAGDGSQAVTMGTVSVSTGAGPAPRRASMPPARSGSDTGEVSVADVSDQLASSAAEAAPFVDVPERVLHITNVGDRIVVSEATPGTTAATDVPQPQRYPANAVNRPQGTTTAVDDSAAPSPRADYEDVYPGCPGVLPQGADEAMADERLALYGCLYYQVCELPTEDSPVMCTWYLNQKIRQ